MKTETVTARELILNSKQFVNNGLTFPSPNDLLKPFLTSEHITGEITFSATGARTIAENGQELTAYERVSATTEIEIDTDLKYTVGLVYSLEQGKPIFKVFSGAKVKACHNLCIWGANKIHKIDNFSNLQSIYQSANDFLKDIQNEIAKTKKIISAMKNFKISTEDSSKILGKILLEVIENKSVCGTQTIVNAGKLLTDLTSKYYHKQENFNAWLMYNALTESYAEKTHILDQPEKVLSLFQIMQNNSANFDTIELKKAATKSLPAKK